MKRIVRPISRISTLALALMGTMQVSNAGDIINDPAKVEFFSYGNTTQDASYQLYTQQKHTFDEALTKARKTSHLNIKGEDLNLETVALIQREGIKHLKIFITYVIDIEMLAHLPTITSLTLQGQTISHEGLSYLSSLPNLEELKIMTIENLDAALPEMTLPSLKKLDLNCANLKGEGIKKISLLKNLEHLDLRFNPEIPEQDFEALKQLKSLKHLNLMGTRITYQTLKSLLQELPHLEILKIAVTRIDEQQLESLIQEFPHLDIHAKV